MTSPNDQRSEPSTEARSAPAEAVPGEAKDGSPAAPANQAAPPARHTAPTTSLPPGTPPAHPWRKWLLLAVVVAGLGGGGVFLVPRGVTALNTGFTDDAYVNG